MTILRATVTRIPVGGLEINGLMDEVGVFYIGVPQAAQLFLEQDSQNQASQTFKRLMGKEFKAHKLKTEFNKNITLGLLLTEFERLVAKLDRKGNKAAQDFRDALVGLSLHQLFCDAFKVKFEAEDRQEWLKERFHHKAHFHPHLTRWLKEDADGDSDAVNWGKEINLFKSACKLPLTCVDSWESKHLQVLNHAETSYNSLRLAGLAHEKAISVLKLQH